MAYFVEPMRVEDIPRVMEIEHHSFSTWWSERSYRRELSENKMAHYVVVRDVIEGGAKPREGEIIGYAGMWVMFDESHITAIAVDPLYRGKGIGELLLMIMFDLAREYGAEVVTLEVRASNSVAQNLYKKYGMAVTGIRKGYYTNEHEDALIMTSEIINTEEFEPRLHSLEEAGFKKLDKPVVKGGGLPETVVSLASFASG